MQHVLDNKRYCLKNTVVIVHLFVCLQVIIKVYVVLEDL